MRRPPSLNALLLIVLSLTGCVAADLKAPISKLVETSTAAKEAIAAQQGAIDDALVAYTADAAIRAGAPVAPGDDECKKRDTSCQLHVKLGGQEFPVTKSAVPHGAIELVDGIVEYSKGLLAIANADTTSAINGALASTKQSVTTLAGTVDKVNNTAPGAAGSVSSKIAPFADPVTTIVSFGFTRYAEQVKLRAIRTAVDRMELVFGDITKTFDGLVEQNRRLNIDAADKALRDASSAYNKNRKDKALLTAYINAAKTMDTSLRQPRNLFSNLAKAHTSLADALHRRNLSFAEMASYLQKVIDEAAVLAAAAKQLKDAGHT